MIGNTAKGGPPWIRIVYALAILALIALCASWYLPGKGFSALVRFGEKRASQYIPELKRIDFFAEPDSDGYDAQYYAQIAMHPQLGDPVLRDAVDSLPYRARRILFCWTAYVAGFGSPEWVLNAFSVQDIVGWLLLAWVLLRWFPPSNWQNFIRWLGVIFTSGLCFSVRGSLVDCPSLLLIAAGMALLESGRPWWSAAVLGVAGLGKETNILGTSIFLPEKLKPRSAWVSATGQAALVIAPLAAWLLCLQLWLGRGGDLGARNFDWPFFGYMRKWNETLHAFLGHGSGAIGRAGTLAMTALTVQWLFFALRPRWRDPWWRLGASYAVLMVVLGDAVWEGFPGAAPRVLLPMTLAFNVALPRGRKWWLVLVLGNLLVLPSVDTLVPPGKESYQILGSRELRVEEGNGDEVKVTFDDNEWCGLERSYVDYWRWARGSAAIKLHNPHPYPILVDVRFRLKSSDARNVTVRTGGRTLWQGPTEQTMPELVFQEIRLAPGDTVLNFDTDRPAANPPNGDVRKVSFRVCNFAIQITGRAK